MKGIKAFREDYKPEKAIIVCNEKEPRLSDGVNIMPYRVFLDALWNGDVI